MKYRTLFTAQGTLLSLLSTSLVHAQAPDEVQAREVQAPEVQAESANLPSADLPSAFMPPGPDATAEAGANMPALDSIRLRSGAVFRGQVLEYEPSSRAVLRMHDGSSRTFGGEDIVSLTLAAEPLPTAGCAEAMPQAVAASESPAVHAEPRLTVRGWPGYLVYAREVTQGKPAELCASDCNVSLPSGDYYFGVAKPGRPVVEAANPVSIRESSRVEVLPESHQASRIGGAVVLGAGLGLGASFFVNGARAYDAAYACSSWYDSCEERATDARRPWRVAGALSTVAGLLLGVVLLARKDRAHVSVRSQQRPHESAEAEPEARPAPQKTAAATKP